MSFCPFPRLGFITIAQLSAHFPSPLLVLPAAHCSVPKLCLPVPIPILLSLLPLAQFSPAFLALSPCLPNSTWALFPQPLTRTFLPIRWSECPASFQIEPKQVGSHSQRLSIVMWLSCRGGATDVKWESEGGVQGFTWMSWNLSSFSGEFKIQASRTILRTKL